MSYLKSMHIKGLKKFKDIEVNFNKHVNILVGENEAGKSTILEALKIVLNQQYKTADKAILNELFNRENVEFFRSNPSMNSLPFIVIDLRLSLDKKEKNSEYFFGQMQGMNVPDFGIVFECKYNEELGQGLESEIQNGRIPLEYYSLSWKTYAGCAYQIIKRPLKFISIDTSTTDKYASFNYYNKMLFNNTCDDSIRINAKNEFREKISDAFSGLNLPELSANERFGIDGKKVILENIISIYEDGIPLENKGSGKESLIKTEIALNKQSSKLDVILMEEPENHLSHSNLLKMLKTIEQRQINSQIIVATHSNMIASRLGLKNVKWITDNKIKSLEDISCEETDFFSKADNNEFLNLLLSKKAILVEGATEYLLLPRFYEQIYNRTIEADKITIISCGGIAYKHYLSVIKETNKKVAVITDNDKKQNNLDESNKYNSENQKTHIFMSEDLEDEWTWEAAIYHRNISLMEELIEVKNGADYLFHNQDYGQILGKMLNNKVDTAYKMLNTEIEYNIPDYVKEAFEWIRK